MQEYICTGQIIWTKEIKYIYPNQDDSRYDDAHFIFV
jgi:hypothetical protein